MPTISVIVPVYRVEKFIHRCVDSVLAQSFQEYELILVDDGSPDHSGEICEEYAARDNRIRVIHKENGGLSSARNAGIDAAKGAYLFFVDSDDVIHPDCLNILMNCIQRSGADIAVGEFARFSGEYPDENQFTAWNGTYRCLTGRETLGAFFDGRENMHSLVSACCKIYKRALFTALRFPVGRLFEDEFTTYQLYDRASNVVFPDQVLYYYFINDGGITGNLTLQKRFDEYDAQWERLMYFRGRELDGLAGKAAVTFLKTAQWDLIACRKGSEPADRHKKQALEKQYTAAFRIARCKKKLDFLNHYDFYVLAWPQWKPLWRLRRLILLRFCRKE